MPRTPRALVLAALAASLVLGACGEDDAVESGDDGAAESAEGAGPEVIEVTGGFGEEPSIELNRAGSVEELYVEDLVEGDGDEVGAGDTVEVHYAGVRLDGEEFDSSFGGDPVSFGLDGVIAGWTEGIPGMKVGGRRLLVIPAAMAYGEEAEAAAAGRPGGTLVFVVDLVSIPARAPEPVDPEGDGSGVVGVTGAFGDAPVVALNGVEPATEITTTDVITGDGAEVTATSTLSVHILALLLDGTDAGSTWTNGGQPTPLTMAELPPGIATALTGMRVGGRRLVVAPTSAAQPEGQPPPATPGDTIVLVFDLVEVTG